MFSKVLALFAFLGCNSLANAFELTPYLDIHALLDTRLVYSNTEDETNWFDGGLGKTRYDDDFSINIAEAALLLEAKFDEDLKLNLYAKYDKEQDFDLVEAFVHYQKKLAGNGQIKFRGGIFFPQLSLENSERFWLSAYNITPSAINSWIGEEVRTTGAELKLSYQLDDHYFSWLGSIFMLNDPIGSLLAWRGWAIHSQKSGVFSHVPLAQLPEFNAGGIFRPSQETYVDPFREIDYRAGFSTALEWRYKKHFELSGLYYNNNANPSKQDGSQYAWETSFLHFGLKANIADYFEFLSQYISGNSKMGPSTVNIDFQSYYFMLRKKLNQHKFSLRYEHFSVKDLDGTIANDYNNEEGWGLTAAYAYELNSHHKFIFEVSHIESDRQMRTFFNRNRKQNINNIQISYRLSW